MADRAGQILREKEASVEESLIPNKDRSTKIIAAIDLQRPGFQLTNNAFHANAEMRESADKLVLSLPPAEQKQVANLRVILSEPAASLALTQLLAEGTLHQRDSKGNTLLSTLSLLATGGGAKEIDTQKLLNTLVLEIAQPSSIQQVKKTCGPAAVAMYMASTRPAEYGRIVAGLASERGTVNLVNGTLTRKPSALEDNSQRTISQQLLLPALMEFGNGPFLEYDNKRDVHTIGGVATIPGAPTWFIARMLEGLIGERHSIDPERLPGMARLQRMDASLAKDEPVLCAIRYGQNTIANFHWVLVTKADQSTVTMLNPKGMEEVMPRKDFVDKLLASVLVDN